MSRTIENFKIGDRIIQRIRKGNPMAGSHLPIGGTITNIYWVDKGGGERTKIYELDGKPVGWLMPYEWLYD